LSGINDKPVIFDLQGVEFMDSSGIGFLIGRYKFAIANGCIVSLRNPAPHIDRMLEMAGIYKIIRKDL
jgi:stage II sporulation protein AA (anti-sigma F factor antagonist)